MSEKPEEKKEEEGTPAPEGTEGSPEKKPDEGENKQEPGEEKKDASPEEKKSEEGKPDEGEGQPPKEEKVDSGKVADDLLSDGTPASKDISIKKTKFDDLSDKAKLFEQYAPTLAKLHEKVKDDPTLLDKILDTPEKGDLGERLAGLEKELDDRKRKETKSVLTQAIEMWQKEFTDHWKEIQPLTAELEKTGYTYREALQRATYAINPELLKNEKRLIRDREARDYENNQGKQAGGGSGGHAVHDGGKDDYNTTDGDKMWAAKYNVDLKLYKTGAKFLKDKGFDQL